MRCGDRLEANSLSAPWQPGQMTGFSSANGFVAHLMGMAWMIAKRGRWGRFGVWMAVVVLGASVGLRAQVAAKATTGSVVGTVTDAQGRLVQQAQVTLTVDDGADGVPALPMVVKTDAEGDFKFVDVPAGHFLIAVTAEGFQATTTEGTLLGGQYDELPTIVLQVGVATSTVNVTPLTNVELAELDVKAEEQQKVFGIIPNYFVVFKDHPLPLNARQKMELSIRGTVDPFSFISSGVVAGVEQGLNTFPGYHQGFEGYAKRYGATYANFATATLLRHGVFPAVFHQDPRYYYKGKGSKLSRTLYALSTAVVCKGDNGRNEVNYSSILGNFSAGALTNLYYPDGSKNGLSTTLENGALATVGVGVGHVLQEFLFSRITNKKSATSGQQPTR